MCFFFFLIQCVHTLPLEIGLLKVSPVLNSFPMIYPRAFLEGRCHSQPRRPCEDQVPLSTGFKVVVTGNGHKEAAFLRDWLWFPGNQSLRQSAVPGLPVRGEWARRNAPGLCLVTSSPHPLRPFLPSASPHSGVTTLLRVLSSVGRWGDPKEAWSPGDSRSSSSPWAPPSFGRTCLVSL